MEGTVIKNLWANLRTLLTTDIRKRIKALENGMDTRMTEKFFYLHVLDYFATHKQEAEPYAQELAFLQTSGNYSNFPYPSCQKQINVLSGKDSKTGLFYVIHNGRKLFFPKEYSITDAERSYRNYIENEHLLDLGDEEGRPHQYQSPRVHVEEGDVLFDIGAAEGLFALDQVEKASRLVLVESDSRWIAPLQQTFAPYKGKVTIIQRLLSTSNTDNTLSLTSLLDEVDFTSAFIKMDIEGYDLPALVSTANLFSQKQPKLAIASYHRQHDAEEIMSFLEQQGYSTEFSSGYMLFHEYDTPTPPYFRRGIVRAVMPSQKR